MTINKQKRFAQMGDFDHVLEHTDFQDPENEKPKSRWHEQIFGNSNPITLELACGTGTYAVELARRNPERNYIGIDIKGARMWKGVRKTEAEELGNVRFLRIFIDHLDEYFGRGEVDEIWMTFPDPFPRGGDRSRRLTSPKFLKLYEIVLPKGGLVHLKTDDTQFYDYTQRSVKKYGGKVFRKVDDIYKSCPDDELLTIKTVFEEKHLSRQRTISYCNFAIN